MFDANDFFSNSAGEPKGDYAHDQYGASLGGPIVKQRVFFFVDYERSRNNLPFTHNSSVPTDLQKSGDFSQTFNSDGSLKTIFDPKSVTPITDPATGEILDYQRAPFAGNRINAAQLDPIGAKVINLFKGPTGAGDPITGLNNFTAKLVDVSPSYQVDGNVDYYLNSANRLAVRYSFSRKTDTTPDPFLGGSISKFNTEGGTIEHTWTPSSTFVLTNRIGITRFLNPQNVQQSVDPLTIGFPKELILNPWFEQKKFPNIDFGDGYQSLVSDICSTNTVETDTQWAFSSTATKVVGRHNLKFGGERRIFLNNFFQPGNTSGSFAFGPEITASSVLDPNTDAQGNGLASLLVGFPSSGIVSAVPSVANKALETGFFIQDDWKATHKLTLNLGLRYEWSTPYTERFNRNEFTCLSCDTGISVPGVGKILGTTVLATNDHRHSDSDMNNFGPRLGFAYALNEKTVIRGGAGLYYGMSYATNWQYGGASWSKDINIYTTRDSGVTQYATMQNPFPNGFIGPQGSKYGDLGLWGGDNINHAGQQNRNAEIYQWNVGIQRQLPGSMLVEVNYSASRSVHLPWKKSPQNYNFVSTADREKYGTAGLNQQVANPFQYLFQGPNAKFNEPDSLYNDATIPRLFLLRPYRQFGYFGAFPPFAATARYDSLQIRFEKRYSGA